MFLHARQLLAHGELQLQIDAVTRQLEKDTNNAALYLRRGELHRQHQDWVHATADYDRAANIDHRLAAVDLCRGKMFLDMGKFREAKTALDKYFLVEPDDSEALVTRARVLVKLGAGKAAADDFSRAIVLASDPQPDYYLERARALVAEGDLRS